MTELLELGPVEAAEYAAIEDRFASLLGTRHDLIVLQGEAVLPLEATARGLARPGSRAINIVTSAYGANFGDWLRQGGATVVDITVPFDRAVSVEQVARELEGSGGADIVSLVHAEAASGVVNPLREIAALAHAAGALVVVDAVASIGAEPLEIDDWALDVVVVSAQKALAGPTGVSAVILAARVWEQLADNPSAPRHSLLSLLDWREQWLDSGRTTLPVIPHHVELRLLGVALDRAAGESLNGVIARHRHAADVSRRGLETLGLIPWVAESAQAAGIATTFRTPADRAPAELLAALDLEPRWLVGLAPAAPTEALRINHMGRDATEPAVAHALGALRRVLEDESASSTRRDQRR
jgi:aspartate aminotransferase-like enzyme